MNNNLKTYTCQLNNEQSVQIEIGEIVQQAQGSVVLRQGDNTILVTCCVSDKPKDGIDFFPLTVDFEEKMYALGEIPGSYNRREGRPSDKAILVSRLIDRPIRPLFPKGYHNDVTITATVLSADNEQQVESLCIFGASLAVALAGLPVSNYLGGVRVGLIDEQLVLNPIYQDMETSTLDLIVAGNKENIMMVEAGATFVSEDILVKGISFAQEYINKQINTIEEIVKDQNITKQEITTPEKNLEIQKQVKSLIEKELTEVIEKAIPVKKEREDALKEVSTKIKDHYDNLIKDATDYLTIEELKSQKSQALDETRALEKSIMRKQILEKGLRVDGRKCNEVRHIWSKAGYLPRVHGSALFTRGDTQGLSIATVGSAGDAKSIDGIWLEKTKRYFHHYNFPPYSVGEARSLRSPGRREIGHGALAERAILPTLPSEEEFPYTIRTVTEILGSNGSTSMASTCSACLALMDTGVPIKHTIGGIAMGLIVEDSQCAILSDIQGVEDFLGDMDFKVTGSRDGITALQLDLKLPNGVSLKVLNVALQQAKEGRVHIIDKMEEELNAPRPELSPNAPRIVRFAIDEKDIGAVIGSGGKNIKKLIEDHELDKIDITDDGMVSIAGSPENIDAAKHAIEILTFKVEVGEEYPGVVVRKIDKGILVEIVPGKTGLFPTGGGYRGGGGRYNNNRNQSRQETPAPDNKEADKYKDLEVGAHVLVVVGNVDMRGRINLRSLTPLD